LPAVHGDWREQICSQILTRDGYAFADTGQVQQLTE
jgi:hypothetical protein